MELLPVVGDLIRYIILFLSNIEASDHVIMLTAGYLGSNDELYFLNDFLDPVKLIKLFV